MVSRMYMVFWPLTVTILLPIRRHHPRQYYCISETNLLDLVLGGQPEFPTDYYNSYIN